MEDKFTDGLATLVEGLGKIASSLGIDVNGLKDCDYTPLMIACETDCESLVKSLLEAGADISREYNGDQAIHLVRSPEVLKLMISHGANPETKGKDGRRLIHYACRDTRKELLICLVNELGVDFMAKDDYRQDPITYMKKHKPKESCLSDSDDMDSDERKNFRTSRRMKRIERWLTKKQSRISQKI